MYKERDEKMYKIFSHNDLDGYSVNTICNFYNINVEIKNINNKMVDIELMSFFSSGKHFNYEKVFLIDLYINKATAKYIDEHVDNFILLDHHKSGEFLNIYKWATVMVDVKNIPACGASLFYDYLSNESVIVKKQTMNQYVESVRLFDTGEYLRISYNKQYLPEELNALFYLYFKYFPAHICSNMRKQTLLNCSDEKVAKALLSKMRIYAMNKSKEIISFNFENYLVGVLFIEDAININNTFKICSDKYVQYDFFMFINMFKGISLRTFNSVDLSVIVDKYNGGGHAMAAGMPYDEELVLNILNSK